MRYEIIALMAVVLVSGCLHAAPAENDTDTDGPEAPEDSTVPNETSTPTDNEASSNTVYLTSSGFTPSTITVEQGETVTWINNASRSMWVASDRHPTHTDYAGSTLREHCQDGDQTSSAFDQCSSGDRFSFTFEKTGEWRYHNHDSAGQTGTVVVE